MSWDVYFRAKLEGIDAYVDVYPCNANVTSNLRTMIETATELPWVSGNNGRLVDVMPKIEAGLFKIIRDPWAFKKYEAPNGWGTVEGARNFLGLIMSQWRMMQKESPDIAEVAVLWLSN